ncbi:ArnT family glycosyltransferase [Devosia sp.]|uniref:ArnT family glycosyltransferase n=1 Tax=Devosia sp. TaxID=1871048 RepID=UPI002F1E99FD
MTAAAQPLAAPRAELRWLPFAAVAGFFLVLKAMMSAVMSPIGDEAYYWLWGQHPDLSYFDHPPLHAWLLRLMQALFGWNLFSLRILTWATLLATLAVFWSWAGRLAPTDRPSHFWRMTAIYLASPLFLGMTTIAFNDHLMMALVVLSAHAMLLFAERWEAHGRGYRLLYLSALLLGLAVLSKYNAVFLGLGYAVFILLRPALRPLLATPHLWLAGLLSIAVQAPVFWWNFAAGFASYRFHFTERWNGPLRLSWEAPVLFVIVALIVVSPFAAVGVVRYLRRRPDGAFAVRARQLAGAVFAVSSLAMLVLASFAEVFFYWNIVAFILVLPLAVDAIGRRWLFWLHMLYGAGMALLLVFNQLVAPVGNVFGAYDWTISSTYGWDRIGREVEAVRAEHPEAFVATSFYTTAAQLGFAIGDAEVTALSPRHDQFDFWFDPEAHRGDDAVIVADRVYTVDHAARLFDSIVPVRQVEITSFGRVIYAPTIYLARGFRPPAAQ